MALAPRSGTFRLLYVCTGNICRSPFAEILTRHLLAERLGEGPASRFAVSSAGVEAVVESAMHPDTCKQLGPWGLEELGSVHESRQLEPEMLERVDLVLGVTTQHRAGIVLMAPTTLPIAYSLREFARIAATFDPASFEGGPVERARELVQRVRRRRGMVRAEKPEDDQVPDPIGRSAAVHRDATALIAAAVTTIVEVIAPPK